MALSTVTVTLSPYPDGQDQTERNFIYRGTVAIQASPGTYTAGGLAISWAQEGIHSLTPVDIDFKSITGSGYVYTWIKSTGKIMVQQSAGSAAPLAEIATAATPAGVSGDTIQFRGFFRKFI